MNPHSLEQGYLPRSAY